MHKQISNLCYFKSDTFFIFFIRWWLYVPLSSTDVHFFFRAYLTVVFMCVFNLFYIWSIFLSTFIIITTVFCNLLFPFSLLAIFFYNNFFFLLCFAKMQLMIFFRIEDNLKFNLFIQFIFHLIQFKIFIKSSIHLLPLDINFPSWISFSFLFQLQLLFILFYTKMIQESQI